MPEGIFIDYLCPQSEDKPHLNTKNKQAYFVLFSVCIIFVANYHIYLK